MFTLSMQIPTGIGSKLRKVRKEKEFIFSIFPGL